MPPLDSEGRLLGYQDHFKHPIVYKKYLEIYENSFYTIFSKQEILFNFVLKIPLKIKRHKKISK